MSVFKIGTKFQLVCPEGFRPMTKDERANLRIAEDGDILCLTNEAEHMLVSIGWKEVNVGVSLLLHLIRPVKSVEASVNRSMSPYGYRLEEMLERQIGGQPVQGFRYTYTAGGTPMVGESYVLRQGRSLTFFHGYMPQELRESALALWHGLLDEVQPL